MQQWSLTLFTITAGQNLHQWSVIKTCPQSLKDLTTISRIHSFNLFLLDFQPFLRFLLFCLEIHSDIPSWKQLSLAPTWLHSLQTPISSLLNFTEGSAMLSSSMSSPWHLHNPSLAPKKRSLEILPTGSPLASPYQTVVELNAAVIKSFLLKNSPSFMPQTI